MVATLCIVTTMTKITVFVSITCVTVMLSARTDLMKSQNFVEVGQYSGLNTILSDVFCLDSFAFWKPKILNYLAFQCFFDFERS